MDIVTIPKTIIRSSGSYVGNDTDNRAIPHSLGRKPMAVFILCQAALKEFRIYGDMGRIWAAGWPITSPNAANFYVGNVGSYANSGNAAGSTYEWFAFA